MSLSFGNTLLDPAYAQFCASTQLVRFFDISKALVCLQASNFRQMGVVRKAWFINGCAIPDQTRRAAKTPAQPGSHVRRVEQLGIMGGDSRASTDMPPEVVLDTSPQGCALIIYGSVICKPQNCCVSYSRASVVYLSTIKCVGYGTTRKLDSSGPNYNVSLSSYAKILLGLQLADVSSCMGKCLTED